MAAAFSPARRVELERLRERAALDLRRARRLQSHAEALRLRQLLVAINDELAKERRRARLHARDLAAEARLRATGATVQQIRAWGLANGLTTSTRARLPRQLIEAYAAAHPTQNHQEPSSP